MITETYAARSPSETTMSLEMVCHRHDGELRFSTLPEYDAHDSTGAPLWEGTIIVSGGPRSGLSTGCYYVPEIEADLVACIAHRAAELRVMAEGLATGGAARSVH